MVRSPRVTSVNRGKPVHCVYRLVKYGIGDLVFELNFKAFHISVHHNTTWCSTGYLQIVDSPLRTNVSGYFCGKLQHGRTFLAESEYVLLVFQSSSYTRQTYFRVQISVLPKRLAQERHKELVLDNPGHRIPHTYCDKQYVNCQGFCDVTSPGYPGFYPRNVTCRYRVVFNETANARVVLGGQYYDSFEVWGGPWSSSRCHSNYCTSKEITTQCPYDHLNIYDVTSQGLKPIQKFCGRGHLPRIISRGQEIVLEFKSSVAGSLANDGFHLSIGTESRSEYQIGSEVKSDGSCHFVFNSDKVTYGQFQNLRHWYAPNTRCSYKFVGSSPDQRVFLHFVNFISNRDESCRSKLTLYDADGPNGDAVRGMFCGQYQPNETLLSVSRFFYIEFDSKLGSYDGSNFEYSVLYTFVETKTSGNKVNGSSCDELFSSQSGPKNGYFDFLKNRLRLRQRHLKCTFKFYGRKTEKIRITFFGLNFDPTKHCDGQQKTLCLNGDDRDENNVFDSLTFRDSHRKISECVCDSVYLPYQFTSIDSYLEINLHLHNIPALAYRDPYTYAFHGQYEFLQVGCGESALVGQQGQLVFPTLPPSLLPTRVYCRWHLQVAVQRHVLLKFAYFKMADNCSMSNLKIHLPSSKQKLCRDNHDQEIMIFFQKDAVRSDEKSGANREIVLELNTTSLTAFKMLWTEMTTKPSQYEGNGNPMAGSDACQFQCPGSQYCIAYDLVCNGVINCPITNFTWDPLDESVTECAALGVILQWILLTFSSSFAFVLLIAISLIWRKKFCRRAQ